MKFRRLEAYLVLGVYLLAGVALGYVAGKERHTPRKDAVTVDVVKEGDEILIYERYSGNLIFEYNKDKEVDREGFRVFEEVWREVRSLGMESAYSKS